MAAHRGCWPRQISEEVCWLTGSRSTFKSSGQAVAHARQLLCNNYPVLSPSPPHRSQNSPVWASPKGLSLWVGGCRHVPNDIRLSLLPSIKKKGAPFSIFLDLNMMELTVMKTNTNSFTSGGPWVRKGLLSQYRQNLNRHTDFSAHSASIQQGICSWISWLNKTSIPHVKRFWICF